MTTNQIIYRKQLLAKIHQIPFVKQAKAAEGWEDWLKERYGVTSSAKLSIDELDNLLNILNDRESEAKIGGSRPRDESKATDRQITAMVSVWRERAHNPSEMALRSFVERIIKRKPLHLEQITKLEATKIITAIKRL